MYKMTLEFRRGFVYAHGFDGVIRHKDPNLKRVCVEGMSGDNVLGYRNPYSCTCVVHLRSKYSPPSHLY